MREEDLWGPKRKMNLRLEGAVERVVEGAMERELGGDTHSVQGSRRFGGRGGKSCIGDAKEDAPVWGVDTWSRCVSWGTRMAWPVGISEAGEERMILRFGGRTLRDSDLKIIWPSRVGSVVEL